MRRSTILAVLAGVALMSGPSVAFDGSGIAGIYGDEQGRLGCAADGEYLEFTDDGRVMLREHADDPGQQVGKYEASGDARVVVELTDPPGHAVQLSVQGTRLAIVGYTVNGVMDPGELDAWTSRHEAFVPCAEVR